jgi:hypothetical protein
VVDVVYPQAASLEAGHFCTRLRIPSRAACGRAPRSAEQFAMSFHQDGLAGELSGLPGGHRIIRLLRLDGHSNIAAANRHHARNPQRTLTLLQAA